MGHGQGAKVEDFGAPQQLQGQLLLPEHHIRPGLAVEGKIPVSVGGGFDKGQGGGNVLVHFQGLGADAGFLQHALQKPPKEVVSHLAHKGAASSKLSQHGQHIAGRSPGTGLKEGIPLGRNPVFRKIDQQLTESHHVKGLLHCRILLNIVTRSNRSGTLPVG